MPQYTAPEILAGDAVAPASDIWSIGCYIYLLATGTNAVSSEATVIDGDGGVIQDPKIDFPADIFPKDAAITSFCTAMLTVDPKKRPTAEDLLNHRFLTSRDPLVSSGGDLTNSLQTLRTTQNALKEILANRRSVSRKIRGSRIN